ncbi:hypothetical protein, partial [uncultured Duncaniella sp.]
CSASVFFDMDMSTCCTTSGQMLKTRRLNRLKNVMCYGQSPNIPAVEFEMYKIGYGPLSVIVSLSDFSWKIERESEEICSYNYVEHKEMSRFCNYFIDNAIKK